MALTTQGVTTQGLENQIGQGMDKNAAFRQWISTPQGMAEYQKGVDNRWDDIQAGRNGYNGPDSWFSTFLSKAIDHIPQIYGAMLTAGAAGAFGEAAGAAAGAGEGAAAGSAMDGIGAGLASGGAEAAGGSALGGAGAAAGGLGGAGAGAGLASLGEDTGGGLGGIGDGGPMQQVVIHAPSATPSTGLGTMGTIGAGAGGVAALSNILGSNPQIPIDQNITQQMPNMNQGVPPENVVNVPGVRPPSDSGDGGYGAIGAGLLGGLGGTALGTAIGSGGTGTGITPGGSSTGTTPSLGGLGSLLNGLLPLISGNNDRIKAQQDSDWWNGQLNTLMGMYQPGTPEATLMQHQMEARDAATGRRSQYGQRAEELAANLAGKRAGIMTSAGYQNMANAYRNRSSQDLNGLFGALGNSSTTGLLNTIGNGLGSLFSAQTAPTR